MKPSLPSQTATPRIIFADILRIVAILAVISIHVHTHIFYNQGAEDQAWWISNILFSSTKWAVPVFVMLSGAFLLNPQKEFSTRKNLMKRIFKLLVPLIFWLIICKIFAFILFPLQSNDMSYLEKGVYLFKNDALTYHLWFLYMLIGLYLLSPLLRAFIKVEPESVFILLLLSFLANSVLMLFLFLNIERVVYNPFYYFSGFIVYFIAGYYFLYRTISTKLKYMIYGLAFIACLIGIVMNFILLERNVPRWDIFIDNLSPALILISVAVFLFFKNMRWEKVISVKTSAFIQKLSAYSYGIYLVHTIVLAIVRQFIAFEHGALNLLIEIPLIVVVVFAISLLTVVMIKKVKILNYIVP